MENGQLKMDNAEAEVAPRNTQNYRQSTPGMQTPAPAVRPSGIFNCPLSIFNSPRCHNLPKFAEIFPSNKGGAELF